MSRLAHGLEKQVCAGNMSSVQVEFSAKTVIFHPEKMKFFGLCRQPGCMCCNFSRYGLAGGTTSHFFDLLDNLDSKNERQS